MCQVTHVTESMGPNNNGQGKESGVELKVTYDMQGDGNSNSPQGLVSLRSGTDTVENKESVSTGSNPQQRKTGTEWSLMTEGSVRAVETRSKRKQGEALVNNSAGGPLGGNADASVDLGGKVILSSFSGEEIASFQQKDPDISFVYENLLVGRTRPSNSEAVTKSAAARHYWVI